MLTGNYTSRNLYEEFRNGIPIDLGKVFEYAILGICVGRILEGEYRKFGMCAVKHIVIVRVLDRDTKILVESRNFFCIFSFRHIHMF